MAKLLMRSRRKKPTKLALSKIIEIYSRMFKAKPFSTIFLPLAEAYRKNGQLGEAAELLQSGLARMPDYHSARVALAQVYYIMKQFDQARREIDIVIENQPDNIFAHKLSGLIYKKSRRSLEAAIEFKRVLTIKPDDGQSASELKELIKGGFVNGEAVEAIGEMAFGPHARKTEAITFEGPSNEALKDLNTGQAFDRKAIGDCPEFPESFDKATADSFGPASESEGEDFQPEAINPPSSGDPIPGDDSKLEDTIKNLELRLYELKRKKE